MFHVMRVHIILVRFGSEWSPSWKELPAPFAICSLCNLTICYFNYFPFWFDLIWDAWPLHTFSFLNPLGHRLPGTQHYAATKYVHDAGNLPLTNKQAPLRKKIRTNEIKGCSKIIYKLALEARRASFVQNFQRRYTGIIL